MSKLRFVHVFLSLLETNTANTSCSFMGPFFSAILFFVNSAKTVGIKVFKKTSIINC